MDVKVAPVTARRAKDSCLPVAHVGAVGCAHRKGQRIKADSTPSPPPLCVLSAAFSSSGHGFSSSHARMRHSVLCRRVFFFRALTFNPGKHVPLSSGKRGRAFRQAEAGAATAAFHWSISNSSELLRTFEAKLENNVHRCFWFVFQPRRATCVMQPLNLLVRGSNAASLISICL